MTTRDEAILRDVWLFRYATALQIARLHFGGHLKLAQRRLRRLTAQNLVDRFQVEAARRTGFTTWWYRLARPGARLIAAPIGKRVEDFLPPKRPPRTHGFLAHHARVTDFRIWLREACANGDGAFQCQFIPSYEEVREGGRRQRRIAIPFDHRSLIPDGVFTVRRFDGREALFLLEIDRGTEPLTGRHPSAVERKLRYYCDAYDTQAAMAQYGRQFDAKFSGFRVLFTVPSVTRLRGLVNLALRVDLTPLVWVTRDTVLDQAGDLSAACWATTPEGPLRRLTE